MRLALAPGACCCNHLCRCAAFLSPLLTAKVDIEQDADRGHEADDKGQECVGIHDVCRLIKRSDEGQGGERRDMADDKLDGEEETAKGK